MLAKTGRERNLLNSEENTLEEFHTPQGLSRFLPWNVRRKKIKLGKHFIYEIPKPFQFPHNSICQFWDSTNKIVASGTAIRKGVVLTAGHNFESPDLIELAINPTYMVRQAFHANPNVVSRHQIKDVKIHPKWHSEFNDFFDLALVFLETNLDHSLPISNQSEFSPDQSDIWTVGYPKNDHPRQYFGRGRILQTVENMIGYDAPADFGMSGGAVFGLVENKIRLIGMHLGNKNKASDQFEKPFFKGIQFDDHLLEWISTSLSSFNDSSENLTVENNPQSEGQTHA